MICITVKNKRNIYFVVNPRPSKINDNCIIDDIDDSTLLDVFNMFCKHRKSTKSAVKF